MSKLIKRKDGSYSKRGLWDNIRANKGSGKKPTKEMLKQESKIKKEENMNSMYKKGGKAPKKKMMKDSFMEESKEITFDAPGVKPPMKKMMMGGGTETGMEVNGRMNRAMGEATMAGKKKMMGGKYKKGGFPDLNKDGKVTQADILKGRGVSMKKKGGMKYDLGGMLEGARTPAEMQAAFKAANTPTPEMTTGLSNRNSTIDTGQNKMMAKKGGAKSMKPGGGGRFAKMVSGLKKEGKSEDSAKAIAASVGRKKYGKSKFQEMAAAGKKKMMGGKKC
jgi:hypothetical protein